MFERLLPLYLLVALGYVATRVLGVRKEGISTLLIYTVTPAVIWSATQRLALTPARLALPLFTMALCCALALVALRWNRKLPRAERQIMAFIGGNANSGYFGLPVAFALYGDEGFALAALISIGFIIYENSLGFYLVARGAHTAREAGLRLLRLPSLYAFILGVACNLAGWHAPQPLVEVFEHFRGAYAVFGMMMIGMAVADVQRSHVDGAFLLRAQIAKFAVWPLAMALLLKIESFMPIFDEAARRGLWLAAWLPIAGNTVAFAAQFGTAPEKSSLAVLISTLLALLLIPLAV